MPVPIAFQEIFVSDDRIVKAPVLGDVLIFIDEAVLPEHIRGSAVILHHMGRYCPDSDFIKHIGDKKGRDAGGKSFSPVRLIQPVAYGDLVPLLFVAVDLGKTYQMLRIFLQIHSEKHAVICFEALVIKPLYHFFSIILPLKEECRKILIYLGIGRKSMQGISIIRRHLLQQNHIIRQSRIAFE